MTYVVDTHALVWLLEDSPYISSAAIQALSDASATIVVPTIVLAEIAFLYSRNRIVVPVEEVIEHVSEAANTLIYPLEESVVTRLPTILNIHDAIIVATAIVFRDVVGEPTALVTRDEQIRKSGLVEVIW